MSSENDDNFEFIDIKSTIKSQLLVLGSSCTDRELRREFFNMNGAKLDDELRKRLGLSFTQFLQKIPDVCRTSQVNGELMISRVADAKTAHMDMLKRGEKSKKKKPASFVIRPGSAYSM